MRLGQLPIAAYLLGIPLSSVFIDQVGGNDLARIALLALGLVCAFVLASAGRKPDEDIRTSSRQSVALVLFLLLALASTLHAADPAMAARELGIFAGLAAIALVVGRARDPILGPSVIATTASAAYLAILLLIIGLNYMAGQRLIREELFIGYDNYRFFNHVQTVALPLAVLAVTVAPRRSWLRALAWFSAVGGFAFLFSVAGRGTMLGIVVGAVVVAAIFRRGSFATLRNLAVAAVLGALLFGTLFFFLPLLAGTTPGLSDGHYDARLGSIEARFYLWRIALSYIEQAPWLGIGPMHYAHSQNAVASHPHNMYLQIASEWGVPMLVLVTSAAVVGLYKLAAVVRRCDDTRVRDCGIGLYLVCVAIAVDAFFSGNLVMPVSQVWIAFAVGWVLAWASGQPQGEEVLLRESAGKAPLKRMGFVMLLASQLWLVWSVWPELQELDGHVKQIMDKYPSQVMNPRFWSHGWF